MAAEISKPDFSFQWASGGAIVAPSDVKIQTGWTAEVPPFQWENFAQNRQDNAILHLFQKGISEWDAASNYYFTASGVRSYVQGSDGNIYLAQADSVGQNPVTDVSHTYWVQFGAGGLLGIQKFTANGTYTPTPGMKNCIIEYVGGGGGSGVVVSTTASQTSAVGGGASGSYGKALITAATIGASQAITIGAAGVGGSAGSAGGAGGTTSVGSILTAPGGGGSPASVATATSSSDVGAGGLSGSVATGGNIINTSGEQGAFGFAILSKTLGGGGGSNPLGSGGQSSGASFTPTSGTGYGAGAGGWANGVSTAAKVGIAGLPGVVIIYEYA